MPPHPLPRAVPGRLCVGQGTGCCLHRGWPRSGMRSTHIETGEHPPHKPNLLPLCCCQSHHCKHSKSAASASPAYTICQQPRHHEEVRRRRAVATRQALYREVIAALSGQLGPRHVVPPGTRGAGSSFPNLVGGLSTLSRILLLGLFLISTFECPGTAPRALGSRSLLYKGASHNHPTPFPVPALRDSESLPVSCQASSKSPQRNV